MCCHMYLPIFIHAATLHMLQGEWEAGQYQGQGKYVWPDGRTYEGAWEHNKMHGSGCFTDINGHRYLAILRCSPCPCLGSRVGCKLNK